jgi:2-dehydropantoate 2-reductase
MKIAVVGCGAIGSFYGARLGRDGHDVHFLLRTDYDVVKERGVNVKSDEGDFNFRPHCALDPIDVGPCDLVLVALKSTANHHYGDLIPPLVDDHTIVVTLQNGLGNEASLSRLFPKEQIMGGLCFVCLNRIEPDVVRHLAHGRIVLGEHGRPPDKRTDELAEIIKRSGTPCTVTDDLERAHWEKLIWNIPFNGLGVAGSAGYEACITGELPPPAERDSVCVTTDRLLTDEGWSELVRALMNEVVAAANALDLKVSPTLVEKNIEATRVMGAYRPSTLVDYERGLPLELDAIFLTPLRLAKKAGVAMPRLEILCRVLQQLQPIAAKPRTLNRPQ